MKKICMTVLLAFTLCQIPTYGQVQEGNISYEVTAPMSLGDFLNSLKSQTDVKIKFDPADLKEFKVNPVKFSNSSLEEIANYLMDNLTVDVQLGDKEMMVSNLFGTSVFGLGNQVDLSGVVVTALGIEREEKALSYNVQQVNSEELTRVKDANFVNSLTGKVAGVQINRSASGVGGATKVVMRGSKSLTGNNNVLYVIDGIPLGNQADRGGDGTGFGGSASGEGIANFNPDDIESISVLSGPSAAALYGSSASQGVILITTKKGKEGKVAVNVSSSVEMMNPLIMPKFQNIYGNVAGDYLTWGDKLDKPTNYDPKDFFQTGFTFNNGFNLSTGTAKNQTYLSAASVNSDGIVPNNKYHRYNATVRNTSKLFDEKLTLDASASYVREYANNMVSFGTYFNPIVGTYLYPRGHNFDRDKYFERYDESKGYGIQNWSVGDLGMGIDNPYWVAYRNLRPEVKDRYMFSALARYEITPSLDATARLRLDNTYGEKQDKRYASTNNIFAGKNGRYSYSNSFFKQRYADVILSYKKDFLEDFNTNINLGSSIEDYDEKGHGYGGDLLLIPNKFTYTNVDPTKAAPSESGGNSRNRNVAVFTSAEFSYNSALYLTLTGRADKPSKLVNSSTQWLFYPSIGVSTVLTELLSADAKASIRNFLPYLKFRASYTEVGLPIQPAGITPGTITRNINGGSVDAYEFYPISDLSGERTKSWEIGLDSRMFNNSLSLAVTLYKSNTTDQLLRAKLSENSGYKFMWYQAGNVENKGIEATLGYNKRIAKDFKINTSFTATANRNKIVELGSSIKNPITGENIVIDNIDVGRFRLSEGGSFGDVYSNQQIKRDAEGYFPYNQGESLQTESTKPYLLGNVNPDWNFGWNTGIDFKGINLNFLFNARLGGIVISKTQAALDKYGVSERSAIARENGGVQLGNIKVDPRAFYDAVYNLDSYNTYSATNVRLQEVSLGYTFSKGFLNNTIKELNVSLIGHNLWMIYNKAPFDPELTASTGNFGQGYDYFMLPSLRTIGASVKFKL